MGGGSPCYKVVNMHGIFLGILLVTAVIMGKLK